MKRVLPWICLALALVGGIVAGWIDFNNDEPQAAALVILSETFMLGFLLPEKALLWAIVVAVCLPGEYLLARGLGYQPVSPPSPAWYASLLSIIPALIGAYTGVLVRLIVKKASVKA